MKKNKKNRKLKKVILFILLMLLVLGSVGGYFIYKKYENEKNEEARLKLIKEINSYYNDVVEVTSDTNLYQLKNDKYIEVGKVYAGEKFNLEKVKIDENTKYFPIKDLGYYISYKDLKEGVLDNKDLRYKKYLVFNENIVTKDKVNLYRNGKVVYTFNFSIDEEIIMKDDNGYYIEYFNELFFVNKEDVLKVYDSNNTTDIEADSVPVTVYHFIYLEGDTSCNEGICHHENQIKEHFNYLKENNYFTMTTTELRLYLEGKIRVPKNSILVTIDDGARAEKFIPFLEEYKINATLFLISGWYPVEKFASPYMELASHTHNLHTPGVCAGGQGSPLKCLDKTKLVADLKQSRDVLSGTEAFCFPFYEYNDYGISALQEAGFKMGFIGGQRKATKGVNLYKIPRISFNRYTTLAQYINAIS